MGTKVSRIPDRKGSTPKVTRMAGPALSRNEKDYMAEDDARTLSRAAAIKADPERMDCACKAACRMVEEKSDELRGLKAVARKARS